MSSTEVVKNLPNDKNGSLNGKITSNKNKQKSRNLKQKCVREGSRICYTDIENITMLKKIPEKDTSRISIIGQPENEIYDKVDSYRSGESLFKTFTFEQTRDIDDPETVKCIEFWKGVMQKNLAPIKCTLIESDKKKQREKKKKSSESKKVLHSEKSTEEAAKIDFAADQEKIWSQAMKEIKNRKLDRLKFYVIERCEYCRDPFTKNFSDETHNESEEQTAQIEALNDWKPKNQGKNKNLSKELLLEKLIPKIRRISATQTTETRVKSEHNEKTISTGNLKTNNSEYTTSKKSDSKLQAIIKHDSYMKAEPSIKSSPEENVQLHSEVQVPGVKCPCDSNTCICPHRAAARKSRTSLVEIVRENMLEDDKSDENLYTIYNDSCICKINKHPWETTICSTEPCISKYPTIQESSSDFNMNRIVEKVEQQTTCICGTLPNVECQSDNCKNKNSQGSLIEDIPATEDNKDNSCACDIPDTVVPCLVETCSKKPSKVSSKCECLNNKPWCELKCQSWKCPNQKFKLHKKQRHDDEEITLRKYAPVKEITSTCICSTPFPWKNVECFCGKCAGKQKLVQIQQVEKEKQPSKVNVKANLPRRSQDNPKSREIANVDHKTNPPTRSEDNLRSKEIINDENKTKYRQKNEEIVNNEQITTQEKNICICSTSAPWSPVTCATYCDTKKTPSRKNEGLKIKSSLTIPFSNNRDDTTCICDDKTLEPTCKAFKCKDRDLEIEYPPPCICPKDLEGSRHEHFTCASEKCRMKKIDETCVCSATPEAPCDNKKCAEKPLASKTLKSAHKRLKYDTKCICKVRGLPTTEEVNCAALDCPFMKKNKLPKNKTPIAVIPVPDEDVITQNEQMNKSKCLCKKADTNNTLCTNQSCRGKKLKKNSITDENDEDEESCICNNIDSVHEVICRQIQCQKVSVSEAGIVMNDKCVCVSMDSPCGESSCPKKSDQIYGEKDKRESIKIERPYCYICGHYDCISSKNKTEGEKVCEKYYNSNAEDNS